MEVIDDEGRQQAKKCRVELLIPENEWNKSFYLSRVRGLSTETRLFCFKLLHQLLPFSERLSQILPNSRPECSLCADQLLDTPLHGLFRCIRNSQASQYLLHLTRPYDSSISEERILLLDIRTSEQIYELPSMLVLATGLSYIWSNRLIKKSTTLFMIRSEMECLVSLLRKSRSRILKEAGNMIHNTIVNFPF